MLIAALAAVVAISSCDPVDPVIPCPVTDLQLSPSYTIGYLMELQGSGFANDAALYVSDVTKMTQLTDVKVEGNKVSAMVPLTVSPGTYSLILGQGGELWELATVLLEAASCPFSDLSLPSVIKIGKPLSVAGTGLKEDYEYSLTADGKKTVLEATATAQGIELVIPESLEAGTYKLVCTVGLVEWTMAESLEAAVYKRLANLVFNMDAQYRFDMEAALAGGLDEMTAGMYEMFAGMMSGSADLFDLGIEYNAEGKPVLLTDKVEGEDGTAVATPFYEFSYPSASQVVAEDVTGYEDLQKAVYTLDETGKVISSVSSFDKDFEFSWNYTDNQLTSILSGSKEWYSLSYTDSNLTGIKSLSDNFPAIATYSADKLNVFSNVDIVKILAMQYGENCLDLDVQLANLIGISGAGSKNVPASFSLYGTPLELSCVLDADAYITSVSYSLAETESMAIPFCFESQSATITLVWE